MPRSPPTSKRDTTPLVCMSREYDRDGSGRQRGGRSGETDLPPTRARLLSADEVKESAPCADSDLSGRNRDHRWWGSTSWCGRPLQRRSGGVARKDSLELGSGADAELEE